MAVQTLLASDTFLAQRDKINSNFINTDVNYGNIADPLVCMPMRRANDATRLSGVETFTRAGTGTYIDPTDGLLKTAAIDEPRYERMADGGVGILLEGTSTNAIPNSESWSVVFGGTVLHNVVTGSDGLLSMSEFKEDAANSTHNSFQVVSVGAGNVSWQIKLKAGLNISLVTLYIASAVDGTTAKVTFDLLNGTFTNIVGFGKMRSLGNGIYLCSVLPTIPSTGVNVTFYARASRLAVGAYQGDGVSTFYYQHPQAEPLSLASSYIPTTGTAVTRAADRLSISVGGNLLKINDAFSIIADADYFGVGDTFPFNAAQLYENTTSFRAFIDTPFQITAGSSTLGTSTLVNSVMRLAFVSDNVSLKSYLDAEIISTGVATNTPSIRSTALHIGSNSTGGYPLYGHIRNFRIYDRALTDQEIGAA